MGRSIWAIFCGIVVACLWIAALDLLNGLLFPWPNGLDRQDKAAVSDHLAGNPGILAAEAGVYLVGSFMGGWIGGRTARRLQVRHGLIVAAILFGCSLILLKDSPHPVWFWFIGPAAFLLGGALGGFVARMNSQKPTPAFS
jgi:pimeloyl-ACP methyl ester carboxylesterase